MAEGDYVLFTAKNDPEWKDDVDHLELKHKHGKYKMYILPEGLPTRQEHQKKFVESREYVPEAKVPKKR